MIEKAISEIEKGISEIEISISGMENGIFMLGIGPGFTGLSPFKRRLFQRHRIKRIYGIDLIGGSLSKNRETT